MTRVFSSSNLLEVRNVQNLLEEAGIATRLRNEHTGTMLPLGQLTAIELWVRDAAREEEARRIARGYLDAQEAPADAALWQCSDCAESNPANFAVCWNCNAAAPAD